MSYWWSAFMFGALVGGGITALLLLVAEWYHSTVEWGDPTPDSRDKQAEFKRIIGRQ